MDYLEHLAELLGCQYLSDLRYRSITDSEAARILSEPEGFPLRGYVAAAEYIIRQTLSCDTSQTARQAIIDYLSALDCHG